MWGFGGLLNRERELNISAADGKIRVLGVTDTRQLFRLLQATPSPATDPLKTGLAKVAWQAGWQNRTS